VAVWDESFDVVIVGSGGGGMVAALAVADAGGKPVILEKQQYVGGSTAMSGGVIWVPNNPLMQADGVPDSYEDGLAYLQAVIGDPDQASSMARREAFLTNGPEMISFIQGKGVQLVRCEGFSDYYDNRNGGNARSRSIEGIPWDGRQLGEWHSKINPGMGRALGMAVKTNEVRNLPVWTRSPTSFKVTMQAVARTYVSRLRHQDLLTNGMSLIGQLTKIAVDAGIPLWLNTRVDELIVEDGRVVGVRATRDGKPIQVRGGKAVLLAAGGFERNAEMRRKYSGDQPNEAQWTVGNLGNTGEVLEAAIALGAKTDYMDDAVWLPATRPELGGSRLALARQYPHTIYVNKSGQRFVNEANSYVEVIKAMYASGGVPAWLIFDDEYQRRYPWGRGLPKLRDIRSTLPGQMPREWITNGWIRKGETLDSLARQIGIDPQALSATVQRFNEYAAKGEDPDFGRGESQHNKMLGDPSHKPNAALGPIEKAPFYATEVYPGDVGTSGGVLTNEYAQVLDKEDQPIPGLYATGNMAATVMGRTYPGAGASIANTMTFGYIAARHATAQAAETQGASSGEHEEA
jgi:3-oxosteroid 1-dehydrogenase